MVTIFTESLGWQVGTLAAGAVLAGLLLAVGHWFPWVRRLGRVPAYVYGVVPLWLGFGLWRILNGDWLTVVGLALIAVAGGATVVGAYWVDGVVERVRMGELMRPAVGGALRGADEARADRGGGE